MENTENINVAFLEAYKSLDDLCGQLFESKTGIDEYLEQMQATEQKESANIPGWLDDLRTLTEYRELRDRLVFEVGTFLLPLAAVEDIQWLSDFRTRIITVDDPFARLENRRRDKTEPIKKPAPKKPAEEDIRRTPRALPRQVGQALIGGAAALAAASAIALRVFRKKDPPSKS